MSGGGLTFWRGIRDASMRGMRGKYLVSYRTLC